MKTQAQLDQEQKAWDEKCNANYETLATKLVSQGYIREERPNKIIYFIKEGEMVYLSRKLGSPHWSIQPSTRLGIL